VDPHSLYARKKKFSRPSGSDDKDARIKQLEHEPTWISEAGHI
jgi:hypothetical protein